MDHSHKFKYIQKYMIKGASQINEEKWVNLSSGGMLNSDYVNSNGSKIYIQKIKYVL